MVQLQNKDHELTIQQQEIANVREINQSQTAIIEEQTRLRAFYQQKLLKFLRDSKAFTADPSTKEQFDKINEYSEMAPEQKEFVNILNDLDVGQELVDSVNKTHAMKKAMDKMSEQLVTLFQNVNKIQEAALTR